MSVSNTRDLLDQLTKLEKSFNEFSFEELTAKDAKELKGIFKEFKKNLENHIYSPSLDLSSSKEELNKKEKLVSKESIKSQNHIISHVSHEMRTPLNSIIGFANLLKDEQLTSSQQKKVQAIQLASNALLKIINELLDYSKVCSDAHVFQKVDFKLRGFIYDVVFLCETLIIDKNVKITTAIGKEVPEYIAGDPSKLSQVLLNLVGNSIKFVPKGQIDIRIDVLEKTSRNCVLEFQVKDNGIGIPKDKILTIFESYNQGQAETFQNYGGTGLGLSITKEIIEKQKGEIKINSIEGQGTSVTFSIPFGIGSLKKNATIHTRTIDVQKGKELLNGANVLVFEDNLMNQHLVKEQLGKWGCKVYTQVGLNKGLSILASKTIDVVLMDLKMPILNGFEITKAIRSHQNKNISNIPIIAFSADFSESDKQKCAELGINDLLLKPYTHDELILKLVKNKKRFNMTPNQDDLLRKKMIEPKETTTLNLDTLLKDCFGEVEMLQELVHLLKNNVIEFLGNVKISLNVNDMKSVALSAHKLKAGLAMIKATGMRNLIVELEAQAKNDRPFEVKELYAEFLADYPLLEINIDKELERISKSK